MLLRVCGAGDQCPRPWLVRRPSPPKLCDQHSRCASGHPEARAAHWLDPRLWPLRGWGPGLLSPSVGGFGSQKDACPGHSQPKSTLSEQKWVPASWPCHYLDAKL